MARIKLKVKNFDIEVEADTMEEAEVCFTKLTANTKSYIGVEDKQIPARDMFLAFFTGIYAGTALLIMQMYFQTLTKEISAAVSSILIIIFIFLSYWLLIKGYNTFIKSRD